MVESKRKLPDFLEVVVEEDEIKGLLTAKRQKLWSSAREKAQNASYKLEMLASSRFRSLCIWVMFEQKMENSTP